MLQDLEKTEKVKIYTLLEDYAGYSTLFKSQHGISFLIESKVDNKTTRVLFDTGTSAEPVLYNLDLLNIDPSSIDMIVLSHNHYDHTGGLKKFVEKIDGQVPIFAHPNIFRKSFAVDPMFRYAGIPPLRGGMKEDIEEIGGIWMLSEDPIKLMPGIFTLGEINSQVEFEKEANIDLYKIEDGKVSKDEIEDEIGLGILTDDGLSIVGGCSHPGIVSMIEQGQNLINTQEINKIIGGFHLKDAEDVRIEQTVKNLKDKKANKIITGHCTGLKAESKFLEIFNDKFEKLNSGKIIEI